MDILPLHPAHQLLGTTPESPSKGLIKIILSSVASLLLCGVMLIEDLNLIQQSRQVISQKMQKHKARRARRNTTCKLDF